MNRIQLFYKDISEIVGSKGFSVARLVDAEEKRALCVICDKAMTEQLAIRYNRLPGRETMLPEVLLQMLAAEGQTEFEVMVYDIVDGQYRASLINKRTLSVRSIRMSDAVLLQYIAHVPIYIEMGLMLRQSTPYSDNQGLSIPINTLDTEHLNRELEKAVEAENYRLASHLHEEILRRNKK